MHYILLAVIIVMLGAPTAQAVTVTTSNVSSSATGGVTAGSGETVVTGSSGSSVQVTNFVSGSNSGGSATTIVETTVNGETTREEKTQTFEPGEPVHVEVNASAHTTGTAEGEQKAATSSSVRVHTSTGVEEVESEESLGEYYLLEEHASPVSEEPRGSLVQTILSFIGSFFSFFK